MAEWLSGRVINVEEGVVLYISSLAEAVMIISLSYLTNLSRLISWTRLSRKPTSHSGGMRWDLVGYERDAVRGISNLPLSHSVMFALG